MPVTVVPPVQDDVAPERGTEALFEEARQRTRRRRRRTAGAVIVVAAAAVCAGYVLRSGGGGPSVVTQTATRPFVNVRAFAGHGELAFVSRGTLWVLDGAGGSLRRVAQTTYIAQPHQVPYGGYVSEPLESVPLPPGSPELSHDGRWLAYLVTPQTADGSPSQLWIARGDGSGAHRVRGLAVDQLVGWSPAVDVLAVTAETQTPRIHYPNGTTARVWRESSVALVAPDGSARTLVSARAAPIHDAMSLANAGQIEDAVWSPSGAALAVSTVDFALSGSATVTAYPLDGSGPTRWFSIRTDQRLPDALQGRGATGTVADLAGWWPGFGIGFWDFNSGATHNNDDTPLELLTAPGAPPRLLARTLSDGATDAIAAAPSGALALVSSTQDGRELGQGKAVQSCDRASLRCSTLPGATVWNGGEPQTRCPDPCREFPHPPSGAPGSGVSLDPAWSPDGRLLAYVKAPVALTGGNPTLQWYGAHELFVYDRRSGTTRRLARIDGAQVPTWSADGRELLYVAGDGLWLVPAGGGRPVEIEHPLYPEASWRSLPDSPLAYYGQIPWDAQFTWWSPDQGG